MEKTAFILLFNRNDGIITIFAQNLDCFVPRSDAKRQKFLYFEFLNL